MVRLADGTLAPHTVAAEAQLYVEDAVAAPGLDGAPGALAVRSALWLLREAAARRWTSTPRSAACRRTRSPNWPGASPATASAPWPMPGGTMSGAGFYTAYAIAMLNTLVGNLNVEGGLVLDAGPFRLTARVRATTSPASPTAPRPRAWASRNRFPYEKSSEFKRKKAAGQPAYPAAAPGIRPPADSARKCWPRRWRATRTAPRSGSTT